MPINEWWTDDPAQKYWMEITDRKDVGGDLRAPQVADDGKPEWGYELVRYVRPDDVVLHWRASPGRRALIGYSRVAGFAYEGIWTWRSKGTSGRARTGPEVDEPAWMAPLADLTLFPVPLAREQLQTYRADVLDLQARLTEAYGGAGLYLPFYDYGARELRATQAYLAKFPAQLLTLFRLDTVPNAQEARGAVEPSRHSRRGSGYLSDVKLKRVVERHAVAMARKVYETQGYECRDVGTTHSYDLHLTKGSEEVHVEVKGSTGTAETVELTSNEVSHSEVDFWETQLVVVDQIACINNSGEWAASGGRLRRWLDWHAAEDRLKATRYRYQLPDADGCTH